MYAPSLFRGKKILITGGGTGLGKAMASQTPEPRRRYRDLRPSQVRLRGNRR